MVSLQFRGCIFSRVQPLYEWAVSDLGPFCPWKKLWRGNIPYRIKPQTSKLSRMMVLLQFRGRIFSRVRPFYERAVSDLGPFCPWKKNLKSNILYQIKPQTSKLTRLVVLLQFRGRIFSCVWPLYEWAVNNLDPFFPWKKTLKRQHSVLNQTTDI